MRSPVKNCGKEKDSIYITTYSANEKGNPSQRRILTAEGIVKDLLFKDEVENIRHSLTDMFFQWIQSEMAYDREDRTDVVCRYQILLDFLNQIETYQNQEKRVSL
jgi:hypothetical protein